MEKKFKDYLKEEVEAVDRRILWLTTYGDVVELKPIIDTLRECKRRLEAIVPEPKTVYGSGSTRHYSKGARHYDHHTETVIDDADVEDLKSVMKGFFGGGITINNVKPKSEVRTSRNGMMSIITHKKGQRFAIDGKVYEFVQDVKLTTQGKEYFVDGRKVQLTDLAVYLGPFDEEGFKKDMAKKGMHFHGRLGTIFF